MASIPPARFRRALAALDGPAFATFVAELWARTGWDTERRGQVVVANRDCESRRLLVLPPRRLSRLRAAPSDGGAVDAVVTARANPGSSTLPRGTPDAAVVDASELRERTLYALPESAANSLCRSHLGVPARDSRWDRADEGSGLRAGPLRYLSQASTPTPVLGALAVAFVAITLLAFVGLSGTAFAPSNAFTERSDDSEAAERASSGAAAAPAENDSVDESVYDVEPTCERGPLEVAETVSAALTGGEKNRALFVYWEFSNPDHRDQTSYSAYVGILRDAFEPVFEADRIEHGEPEELDDGRVRIDATVVDDGDRTEYEYVLREWSEPPYEGCWVVDQFAPA